MVWTFLVPALELLGLFLAALLNQEAARRFPRLKKFELVTRLVTWDEKYAYIEQRFESDGVLCAHAFVKGLFLDAGGKVPTAAVVAELGHAAEPPPFPEAS